MKEKIIILLILFISMILSGERAGSFAIGKGDRNECSEKNKANVLQGLMANIGNIRKTYNEYLQLHPNVNCTLYVRFEVDKNGDVKKCSLDSSNQNADTVLINSILKTSSEINFPEIEYDCVREFSHLFRFEDKTIE